MVFLHPEWNVSCAACSEWMIDSLGVLQRDQTTGEPLERGLAPCPCGSCPKVPAWAKQSDREWDELRALADDLTPANRRALGFFLSRKSSGVVCDDPVYQWYAGIIHRAETEADAVRADREYNSNRALLDSLIAMMTARRR